MSSRTEEDWKKLICPRTISGEPFYRRECIGSCCAAFWWDMPRPPDDIERMVVRSGWQGTADEYKQEDTSWFNAGWRVEKIIPVQPEITFGYRTYAVHWSRPWQPVGFCSAFPHPDRFPVSE